MLRYWMERAGRFPIPRVHQQDEHSCGFLAALVVAQYFDPKLTVMDILRGRAEGLGALSHVGPVRVRSAEDAITVRD